jgi:hypothetical protein
MGTTPPPGMPAAPDGQTRLCRHPASGFEVFTNPPMGSSGQIQMIVVAEGMRDDPSDPGLCFPTDSPPCTGTPTGTGVVTAIVKAP